MSREELYHGEYPSDMTVGEARAEVLRIMQTAQPYTHQPDRVAQVVAWLRDQADPWRNNGLTTDRARIYIEAAIAIEAGEPFKRCSTCGRTAGEPDGIVCSNGFHFQAGEPFKETPDGK